jgi:flavin-dependent dehydrogenase
VREDGRLRGLRIRDADGESELRARLIVDASGIDGAVRTRMPPGPWLENDPFTPADTIFVYMETWADVEGTLGPGVDSFPQYIGWCAPGPGNTRIVGVGMGGGMEAARARHRELVASVPFKGTVLGSTGGCIPFRRPPYSLVDNGLAVVGDAACMNKPFSGEGVTSGFAGCAILVEVADRALASG